MNRRILVAMSGGVDSAVTAGILKEQGNEVEGVYVVAYNEPGCRTDEDRKDALKVAARLGIQLKILDLRKQYKTKVVAYFLSEYEKGRTPNPDVVCNGEIKFGLMLDYAIKQGYDKLATGHYARIGIQYSTLGRRHVLQRPRDLSKDQTYFLWRVGPEKLAKVIFPLGELTKKEVREKARELGLPVADKPDSMGVCMMGELSVKDWLKERLGEQPGEVVMRTHERTNARTHEVIVGEHRGIWTATIGERGGWESLPARQSSKMPALYVVGKDVKKNQIEVGEREACYSKQFIIQNSEFRLNESRINQLIGEEKLWVRIRNLGEFYEIARMQELKNARTEIELKESVFAPAPGQSGVFYAREGREGEEVVVGGGVIE